MFNRTYRYFTEDPLFPFGFGLSYSTFSYSDGGLGEVNSGSIVGKLVSSKLTNASNIPGDEVVELYISHPGVEGAPIRALAGFQRIHLEAHASQTITFTLTPRELSIVDPNGNRLVPAGPVELWLGSSQPAAASTKPGRPVPNGLALKFTITSSTPVPN